MFTHSIRWRLQFWLAFLLLAVLSGFAVSVYQVQRAGMFKTVDEELERRVAALSSAVRGGPPPGFGPGHGPGPHGPERADFDDGPMPPPMRGEPGFGPRGGGPREPPRGPRGFQLSSDAARLFEGTNASDFYFAAWSRAGTLMKGSSSNAPPDLTLPERPQDTLHHIRTRGLFREAFHFTELGDCVLAGRSIAAELKAMGRLKLWLTAAGGAVLAFGLGGGWWLTTRAIRPVEQISAAASRISAGNLSQRVTGADPRNELGRLAEVLNSTFARLESAFVQQKQFTADASHELRTPLAILISEAQTTLARERSASEYRETVEACLATAQQMRRLTESLLDLARLDADRDLVPREQLDLAEVAGASVERIRPLAKKRNIQLKCGFASARITGSRDHLDQLVTNLLSNALHYNKGNGEVRVRVCPEDGKALIIVSDTGIGISAEDLPHIFERFYRADKSRSRSEGRTGLGLAICKAIVENHGGAIEVVSELGTGTKFTIRIPLADA